MLESEEDRAVQEDLERLSVIGEDVSDIANDASYGTEDRIEAIKQAIRSLTHIKRRMLNMTQP